MELVKTVGGGGTIVLFFFLWKAGLIRLNGKGSQSQIRNEIVEMKENHLHEIKSGIDELKELSVEIKQSLQEIIKYGVKIRKNDY